MAVKLEKTKTMSGDSRYSIKLVVEETGTSGNSSTISYTLTATKSSGSGYYTSNSNNQVKVTIDGTEVVNKKIAYDFTGSTPKTITLASGTKPIEHNPDGTKTIACSGYFKDANNSLGNATASGNLTLTPLHKAPEPSINSITETNSTLTGYGIANNQFVAYLSQKQFNVSAVKYDDVSITSYTIKNGTTTATGSSSLLSLNFKNKPLEITNNMVYVQATATDSMGATGTYTRMFGSYILYTPATIVASNFTTKRAGQLTGNITLKASGTYYNGSVGNQTVSPKVSYRYRPQTTPQSSWVNWIDATSSVTTSGSSWSLELNLSGFSYQSAFDFELKATDNVAEANSLNVATASSVVPVGEPTWTEYKDRVDFKKLTIDKQEILAPYTLYEGNESRTDKNITLNDSASNYKILEIYFNYYNPNDAKYKSIKVYEPNGKIALIEGSYANATYLYFESARYTINGTNLTRSSAYRWRFRIDGNATRKDTTTDDPSIWITRVVGYK